MPSQSNIPTSGGARDNNAAAVDDVIKDEGDDDDGPIPFFAGGVGVLPMLEGTVVEQYTRYLLLMLHPVNVKRTI